MIFENVMLMIFIYEKCKASDTCIEQCRRLHHIFFKITDYYLTLSVRMESFAKDG